MTRKAAYHTDCIACGLNFPIVVEIEAGKEPKGQGSDVQKPCPGCDTLNTLTVPHVLAKKEGVRRGGELG